MYETQKNGTNKIKNKTLPKNATAATCNCNRGVPKEHSGPSHYTQVFQIRHFLSYFVFRHAGTLRVKSMSNLSYSRGAHGLQYCEDLGHENAKKNTIFCHRLVTFHEALVKRPMRMHNS